MNDNIKTMGKLHHHHHHHHHSSQKVVVEQQEPEQQQQKLHPTSKLHNNKVSHHHGHDSSTSHSQNTNASKNETKDVDIIIIGAGIVGLTMGLALEKYCPTLNVEIYEQAHKFQDGIGAGIGMYPNGLRVLHDISIQLVTKIQHYGYPYLYRRWEVSFLLCVLLLFFCS